MSSRLRDVEHLFRVVGLFAVGLLVFVAARAMFVPADFGIHGYYRAGALDDARAHEIVFAGRTACPECHDDAVATGAHARVGCEACHGGQAAHAADPSSAVPERLDAGRLCLRCHRSSGSKPRWFPQVDADEHAGGEGCDACHAPHHPKIE